MQEKKTRIPVIPPRKSTTLSSTQEKKTDDIFKKKIWPNNRRLEDVLTLHAPNTAEELRANTANRFDFLGHLHRLIAQGKKEITIVDLGMGDGSNLVGMAQECKRLGINVRLVGVSASPDELRTHACCYANIEIIKGKLPHDDSVMDLLKRFAGKVDIVFDTYGATSYANNSLHCLIFSSILLSKEGICSAITSTEGNEAATVFGDENLREEIADFSQRELGIDVKFRFTDIQSRVDPGQIKRDLLVSTRKSLDREFSANDYLKLCKKADEEVGIAGITKPNWYSYRNFSITMKTYSLFKPLESVPEKVQSRDELKYPNHNYTLL